MLTDRSMLKLCKLAVPEGKAVGVGSQAARSTGSEPSMKRPSGAAPQYSGCAGA